MRRNSSERGVRLRQRAANFAQFGTPAPELTGSLVDDLRCLTVGAQCEIADSFVGGLGSRCRHLRLQSLGDLADQEERNGHDTDYQLEREQCIQL